MLCLTRTVKIPCHLKEMEAQESQQLLHYNFVLGCFLPFFSNTEYQLKLCDPRIVPRHGSDNESPLLSYSANVGKPLEVELFHWSTSATSTLDKEGTVQVTFYLG